MANVVIFQRHWQRRDTAATWLSVNPVLASGEFGYETDTGFVKIGDGVTAWTGLAYIYDGGGGGGGGAVELITTSTVTGSAATNITISGLDLGTDGAYWGIISGKNNTGSGMNVNLFYNSDTTGTNYYRQRLVADGGTASAGRGNDGSLFDVAGSSPFSGHFLVKKDVDGRPRATVQMARDAASSIILMECSHIRNNTANVTSLTINAATSNGFAVGTSLSLYKITP